MGEKQPLGMDSIPDDLYLMAESNAAKMLIDAFLGEQRGSVDQKKFKLGNFVMATILATKVTGLSHEEEIQAALEGLEVPESFTHIMTSIPTEKTSMRHYMSLFYFNHATKAEQKKYGLKIRRATDKQTGRVMHRYELDDSTFINQLAAGSDAN